MQPSPGHFCRVSFEEADFNRNSDGLHAGSLDENELRDQDRLNYSSKTTCITISGAGPITLLFNKCPR